MSTLLATAWGNPRTASFRKRSIRIVDVEGATVHVHVRIAAIVAAVIRAELASGPLREALDGWVPCSDGTSHREYGLAFGPASAFSEDSYRRWLMAEDGGVLVFMGSPEDADKLSAEAEAERVTPAAPAVAEEAGDRWMTCLPGERELKQGDKGDDVLCWQMLMACADQDGVFNEQCVGLAAYWQAKVGIQVTGTVTENLWKWCLPTVANYDVEYGTRGRMVRLLQAVLKAYDYTEDIVVNGVFGRETVIAVRELQASKGLRQTGKMGMLEWSSILGRPVR